MRRSPEAALTRCLANAIANQGRPKIAKAITERAAAFAETRSVALGPQGMSAAKRTLLRQS